MHGQEWPVVVLKLHARTSLMEPSRSMAKSDDPGMITRDITDD
jgi:hypothetical protein